MVYTVYFNWVVWMACRWHVARFWQSTSFCRACFFTCAPFPYSPPQPQCKAWWLYGHISKHGNGKWMKNIALLRDILIWHSVWLGNLGVSMNIRQFLSVVCAKNLRGSGISKPPRGSSYTSSILVNPVTQLNKVEWLFSYCVLSLPLTPFYNLALHRGKDEKASLQIGRA